MLQLGLQSTEEWEEAGGHSMAAALCEGWWGRGVTEIMGGTCTGGRTMVSPKVTFIVPEQRFIHHCISQGLGDSPVTVCDLRLCLASA